MSTEAVIAGVGETPYRRGPSEHSTLQLLADAARRALRNAGLEFRDVDGLGVTSMTLRPDRAIDVAFRLGLRVSWLMEDTSGGAATINMLAHARRAVEAGDAETVLLLAGDAFDPGDFLEQVNAYNSATREHLAGIPFGGPNSLFALVTRRHMRAAGLQRETYGRLVVHQRWWAGLNPNALYRRPLSLDEYLSAPVVAEPLGRFDCVPVAAGADAVIVSRSARPLAGTPVRIRAIRACHNHDLHEGDGIGTGLGQIAGQLWADAGVSPKDVDVASVYDDYPVMVLTQLADLGLVPDDDLERYVNTLCESSRPALNTSGGQLSAGQAGFAGGAHGLVEVVRQLRGEAGDRQVPGARMGVATGYGMVVYRYGACANAVVLEQA